MRELRVHIPVKSYACCFYVGRSYARLQSFDEAVNLGVVSRRERTIGMVQDTH